jgi:hypothetical protein
MSVLNPINKIASDFRISADDIKMTGAIAALAAAYFVGMGGMLCLANHQRPSIYASNAADLKSAAPAFRPVLQYPVLGNG